MKTKICSKCKIEKSITEFHKHKKFFDGLSYWCKFCCKKYRELNREKLNKYNKEYYKKNKEQIKNKQKMDYKINKKKIIQRNIKSVQKIRKIKPWKFILKGVKDRCNNKNNPGYKYYGGRGIKCLITEEELKKLWFEYCAWRLKKPSIDRIDNDGNYEYSNCRFIEMSENSVRLKRKSILQFDLDGNFIKEWNSILMASKVLKISVGNISENLRNKRKTSGGYKWEYK